MSQELLDRYEQLFTQKKLPIILQDQGTCGLVSFWYAAQLRTNGTSTIPFPRKRNRVHGGGLQTSGKSLRNFVKINLGSAQGEILSGEEMQILLDAHGFNSVVANQNWNTRYKQMFIELAFRLAHPVLVAYWATQCNNMIEPTTTNGLGAHWSLIIGEEGTDYLYIEPNNPFKLQKYSKDKFMESNWIVG